MKKDRFSPLLFLLFVFLSLFSCAARYQKDLPPLFHDSPNLKVLSPSVCKSLKVVIDAGHGGRDLGAYSTSLNYYEKELTLKAACQLSDQLEKLGYQTILTRGDDLFVPLKFRTAFANANSQDLFVSIHFNSAPNKKAEGLEVYYHRPKEKTKKSEESRRLALFVLKRVTDLTKASSRGVKEANFAVLRDTKMPAILVEAGFLTNEKERKKICDNNYLKFIAKGIAFGIEDYFLKTEKKYPRRDSNARPVA